MIVMRDDVTPPPTAGIPPNPGRPLQRATRRRSCSAYHPQTPKPQTSIPETKIFRPRNLEVEDPKLVECNAKPPPFPHCATWRPAFCPLV